MTIDNCVYPALNEVHNHLRLFLPASRQSVRKARHHAQISIGEGLAHIDVSLIAGALEADVTGVVAAHALPVFPLSSHLLPLPEADLDPSTAFLRPPLRRGNQ